MDRQSIPNDKQLGANVPLEVFQEFDYLRSFDAPRKQPEVEAPDGNSCHSRKAFPVERVLRYRGLASESPGPNAVRSLAQTTLVHKYYGALLPQGFF
jgi:hypothetical protein